MCRRLMAIFIAIANSINCQFYTTFITHKLFRNCFLYVSLNDFRNVLLLMKWRTPYCCNYVCHTRKWKDVFPIKSHRVWQKYQKEMVKSYSYWQNFPIISAWRLFPYYLWLVKFLTDCRVVILFKDDHYNKSSFN